MTTLDLVLYAHIASLSLAGTGIALADFSAAGWLMNKVDAVSARAVERAHRVVSVGLASLMLTGLYMFWPQRGALAGEPLFWLKMSFVAALVINSFAIEGLMRTATTTAWRALSRTQRLPFVISGAISTISWAGAFTLALVLFG